MTHGLILPPGNGDAYGAYLRESSSLQEQGYSPEVQREAIAALAASLGKRIVLWESDTEKGSRTKRPGYQRLLDAVRRGEVHGVLVYTLSRWGRRAVERLSRGEELDLRGVPLISVREGLDKAGLMRGIYAVIDEQYLRDLAQWVRPARERAAKRGTHMGPTPFGYRRHYPAWDGSANGGKRPAGELVPNPATAWIVRALFERYDAGTESVGDLCVWMNSDPRVPKPPRAPSWSRKRVSDILHNYTYAGGIEYNRRLVGVYARGALTDYYVGDGRHEALVDVALWQRVQERLQRTSPRARKGPFVAPRSPGGTDRGPGRPSRSERGRELGSGLLICGGCGGPMVAHHTHGGRSAAWRCTWRASRQTDCTTPGYLMAPVHEALLRELGRLRGHPWTPQRETRLSGGSPTRVQDAAALRRALDAARSELERHTRAFALLADGTDGAGEGLTAEMVAAFRRVGGELSARISGLQAELAALERVPVPVPALRALHERVRQVGIAHLARSLDPAVPEDRPHLRALLLATVERAWVVERQPAHNPQWVRVEVEWTAPVQVLLDAGLLSLAPPEPAPLRSRRLEGHRLASLRYRERQRLIAENATT